MQQSCHRLCWASDRLARCVLVALCVLGIGISIGCGEGGPSDSNAVPTSEVIASIGASSRVGNEVTVSASLRQISNGNSDVIGLVGREAIVATVDGVRQSLVNVATPDFPLYSTRFVGVRPEGDLEIVFYREGNRDVVSRVELGPDFTVTRPIDAESLYWTDDLILQWTPARSPGRVMRIRVDVSCTRLPGTGTASGILFYLQVEDDGEFIYDLDNLSMSSSPDIDRSVDCTLDLEFRRESSTSIAPPYRQSSSLTAATLRSVEGMTISF